MTNETKARNAAKFRKSANSVQSAMDAYTTALATLAAALTGAEDAQADMFDPECMATIKRAKAYVAGLPSGHALEVMTDEIAGTLNALADEVEIVEAA